MANHPTPPENVALSDLNGERPGPSGSSAEATSLRRTKSSDSLGSFDAWEGDDPAPEQESLLPDQEKQQYPPSNQRQGTSSGRREDHDAASVVRKIVPLEDDPNITTLSVRVFVLGISVCVLTAAVSELFFFKSSAPTLSAFFIILVTLPLGKALARYTPEKRIHIGPWEFEANPGPFTVKEHLLTTILAGSGAGAAYAGDIVAVSCDSVY